MPLLYSTRSDISLTADTTVSIDVTNRKLNIIKDGYMYIIYSKQKEIIEVTKFELSQII